MLSHYIIPYYIILYNKVNPKRYKPEVYLIDSKIVRSPFPEKR